MLFNSYPFLFGFLPITLAGYFWLARYGRRPAASWLALASLGFYAWWDIRFLPILGLSVIWNFGAGCLLYRLVEARRGWLKRFILFVAIAGDLAALGYYKYVNFFIGVAGDLTGLHFAAATSSCCWASRSSRSPKSPSSSTPHRGRRRNSTSSTTSCSSPISRI